MITLFRRLILTFIFSSSVFAGEQTYTQAAFDALQQKGAPILVSIHADWCPTCRAQAPVIKKLLGQEEFKSISALQVDFDQQKDAVKAFKALRQSTLIVFKDGKEIERNMGVTDEQELAALLRKAL